MIFNIPIQGIIASQVLESEEPVQSIGGCYALEQWIPPVDPPEGGEYALEQFT